MLSRRRTVLGGLLALMVVLAGVILFDVLATVFLAITVAYVLSPFYRRLVARGVPAWWASAAATIGMFLGAVLLFLPIAVLLYLRRRALIALLREFPNRFALELLGFSYAIDLADLTAALTGALTTLARQLAFAVPVLVVKLTLFALLVFTLLIHRGQLAAALLEPVPGGYHDIATALHERIRSTLFAIYVLQATTSAGTFATALVLFALLGYQFPIALAVVAAVLQFVPVLGPSLLIGAIAVYHLAVGEITAAIAVGVLGAIFVAWLPDAVIRPRLAKETTGIPGSLYFVGFAGGLLSLGPVGIIAGPLVVALLVEVMVLLAADRDARQTTL